MSKFIQEFVDLGLPSGTLWAKCNVGAFAETESGRYYNRKEAKNIMIQLPSYKQLEELIENTYNCWVTNYNNTNINGRIFISKINRNNAIFIPASGFKCKDGFESNNILGYIWSSKVVTSDDSASIPFLGFYNLRIDVFSSDNYELSMPLRAVTK